MLSRSHVRKSMLSGAFHVEPFSANEHSSRPVTAPHSSSFSFLLSVFPASLRFHNPRARGGRVSRQVKRRCLQTHSLVNSSSPHQPPLGCDCFPLPALCHRRKMIPQATISCSMSLKVTVLFVFHVPLFFSWWPPLNCLRKPGPTLDHPPGGRMKLRRGGGGLWRCVPAQISPCYKHAYDVHQLFYSGGGLLPKPLKRVAIAWFWAMSMSPRPRQKWGNISSTFFTMSLMRETFCWGNCTRSKMIISGM